MHSNLKKLGNILKQEGTSRYERHLPALDPASVKIDDRKLQDFLVYAQRYSKNVLFIDADSRDTDPDESWEYFFNNDNIVMLIANIAVRNMEDTKTAYDGLTAKFMQDKTGDNFSGLLNFTLSLFKKINTWYYSAPAGNSLKSDLTLYIQSYLQKELYALREILFYIRDLGKNNYSPNDFLKEFYNNNKLSEINQLLNSDDIWQISAVENVRLREQIFAGSNEEEKLVSASLVLNKLFDSVFHATGNIINNCKGYLEEVISQKHDHPPHIAFLIVFIKLYGIIQEELNNIPQRHLEYYYSEVLKIKKKAAVPDQAYVVFDLAKGFDVFEIKKGALLSAGKDNNKVELVYETDDDIVINKAKVTSLQSIFIDRNQQKQTLNYYKTAIGNKATSPAVASPGTETPYKIFGAANAESVAEIGFGIASTQFYLAKGERKVVVIFQLQNDIEINEFDTSILKLLLTGEKGWLSSDDKEAGINIQALKKAGASILELDFAISITQQSAITAFSGKLHAGNFNTTFPVLQCILKYPLPKAATDPETEKKRQNQVAQLNVLQKLKIIRTSIRVEVGNIESRLSFDGIKELVLENSEAPLESKKPFYPFTPVPKVGSSFYIGCNDLFYKEMEKLSVNIEWLLPDDFANYYSKYLPPYDSNRFRASVSVLQKRQWQQLDEISLIDKDSDNPRFKVININKEKRGAATVETKSLGSAFDNERKDGTIKLTLNYPDFGHGIYPQLITSAVMEKAASKTSNIDYYNIIKKQLGDSVISIKLPPDIDQRGGSLKVVVYDILEKINKDDQVKTMINAGLSRLIRNYNGSNAVAGRVEAPASVEDQSNIGRELVNDENFIERVFRFLKKVKIIDRSIHYDQDKENAEQVVENLKNKIDVKADFIMPNDRELVNVMIDETNNAINKTVANIVDEIIALKSKGNPGPGEVAALIRKHFDEANKVINDIIAHKIATLLSANEIPPPPYSPMINSISLSYSSVKDSQYASGSDQFYQITPLGIFEINLFNDIGNDKTGNRPVLTSSIFPTSIVENTGGEMQGMLFIGIAGITPGQTVNILVRIAEGTKMNGQKPPLVNWWYLKNYEWKKLEDNYLVSDTTYGFQTTGLIKISIPIDVKNDSTIFGSNSLFWLCAGVTGLRMHFQKCLI